MGVSANITVISAFLAGLLSFLSPCVLPLIPSYMTYITGLSFADLQEEHLSHTIRRRTVLHAVLFIAGFTTVFVLLGASATYLGGFLQQHMTLIRKIGGVLIILFGVHVTGLVPIHLLLGERRVHLQRKPAGFLGSYLVGIAFAAGWTPCIGPILASILMVAATEDTVWHGVLLLLSYSLGLGIPFLLSALAMHQFLTIFNRFKKYIRVFEVITGIFLILVGVMIFNNYFRILGGYTSTILGG
jgi:cytochrome c-type biogenesis protein